MMLVGSESRSAFSIQIAQQILCSTRSVLTRGMSRFNNTPSSQAEAPTGRPASPSLICHSVATTLSSLVGFAAK